MSLTCPACGASEQTGAYCTTCGYPLAPASPAEPPAPRPPETPPATAGFEVLTSPPRYAGFGRRLAAFFLDWFILSIIADIVRFAYRFGTGADSSMVSVDAAMAISSILFLLYFTLMTGDTGQTLGKMLLRIRVTGSDGVRIGYARAILRTLGYILSSFFFCLGFLWAIWDRKKQAWHDKIADTVVIRV